MTKKTLYTKYYILNTNHGFSLIETLVAISIFAIISTITVGIFLYIMKGANKAKQVTRLKQNGALILERIERAIRDARQIDCTISDSSQLYVADQDGEPKVIRCGYDATESKAILEIDGIRLSDQDIEVTSCIFSCDDSTQPTTVSFDLSLSSGDTEEEFSLFIAQRKY